MSTRLTNTHTARGFSDLYHVFTQKQCILCPALRHGCLTLLYVRLEIFSTPGTIAQILLTKYIQCWAAVLCNNHSNYRSIEKRPCEISCKEQWLLLYRNTLQHWRECLPPVECYKTVFRLNGLEPTIHTRCKRNQLKLSPLSTPSLWKSSKTRTIYQTTSSLMYNQTVQLFKYAKWGYFSITDESQKCRLGEPLGGSGVFFPKKILKSEKLWKAISSVLRGQFYLKCSLNRTNLLPFFAQFYLHVFTCNYLILINILCGFKVFWTSVLVK